MKTNQKKKLVVITGASGGIGLASALRFNQEGYPLLLLGRKMDTVKQLKLKDTLCLDVDVTNLEAFRDAVKIAENEFGPADLLINNAGVMLLGQIDEQAPSEWRQMVDVNILGVLNGVNSVLGGMKERHGGTIINISSIAGKKAFANHVAYTATKFAVHGLTENLREENAKYGVRFITVAPGVVDTNLLDQTTSNEIKGAYTDWKKTLGTIFKPAELADILLFTYQQPAHVCIRELVVATTAQEA